MATPFQDINKVVQAAVSSAKEFAEVSDYNDDDFEDNLTTWINDSFEEHDFNDVFEELYSGVLKSSVDTYVAIVS